MIYYIVDKGCILFVLHLFYDTIPGPEQNIRPEI